MDISIKNVSQFVSEIKDVLESNFSNVSLQGEVTNLSLSSSGHWYFNLSDKDALIGAALFKMDALRNPHIKQIKDGDKVIVLGDVNVYAKRGTFQIVVKKIVPAGVGDLKEQFEKLKKKLAAEGLFDIALKKPIPPLPKRVAIITAQRGAALQDFINIYKRRSIWMDLLVLPTLVQGDDSPKSIRASLFRAIKYSMDAPVDKKIDLIVFARGGGSLEDLWAFNDEALAWDIHNCPIPTISAIGHEVDYSICDYVCDLRAETPSAAAEIITHHQTQIKDKMHSCRNRLQSYIEIRVSRFQRRLKEAHPRHNLNLILTRINTIQKRLARCDIQKRLHELTHLREFYLTLDDCIARIHRAFESKTSEIKFKLDKAQGLLKALNPSNVLERGYSYVETEQGSVVTSTKTFDNLPPDAVLKMHYQDGIRKVKKIAE